VSAAQLSAALAGRYRIDRELGAGGMATVYLAHDLRHERDVAIKVLHPDLGAALGGERFLSEIKTTAKLQHPNILPLLDSGDADGLLYYVMPVVTGETLRARLERERQLPIADAVRIASEVAGALDYAHRHGVIHRDIKPENLMLHEGRPMVMDFGIALAVQQAGGQRMTQTGLSLGTPQYMSPEQAMGERAIDARSDIYALAAVTYEMLAGDPPFNGSSIQAIVAKIISEKPTPLRTVRDTVPPGVEHAVLTALAKLPADRFATASEFATALSSPSAGGSAQWTTTPARRQAPLVGVLAIGLLAAGALALWGWLRQPSRSAQVTRVAIALSADQQLQPQFYGFAFDVSPNGDRLAYVGPGPGKGTTQVWIRPLDALAATPLANTTGAVSVKWSPDAHFLAVMASQRVTSIVAADGGRVVPLAGTDASWGPDGRIYFVDRGGRIMREAVGGIPDTLFRGDTSQFITLPAAFPRSDGALYIRTSKGGEAPRSDIIAVDFASGKTSVVGPGVYARILPSNALLFASQEGNVFTVPFDRAAGRMTGTPVLLASVSMGGNAGRSYPQISVSDEGTIVYLTGQLQRQRLTWLDQSGRLVRRLATEGAFWGMSLSPDGSRVAYTLRTDDRVSGAGARGVGDVWVEDLATGAKTQLTNRWFNLRPSWSPDGKSVLYSRIGGADNQELWERRADASAPERLVLSQRAWGHSIGDGRWLPDHKTLIVRTYADPVGTNLYTTTDGATDARPFAVSARQKTGPLPSPDGTLVSYVSDESGTNELYVEPFPGGGQRLKVSDGGASAGRWSHDGRSLYYWDARGKLIVASIASKPALSVTGAREINADVAPSVSSLGSAASFDVTADGRIIVVEDVPGAFDLVLVRNGLGASNKTARE
jgi:eukaryotic-like serine/threonine-protein kinase